MQIEKKEVNQTLFTDDITLHIENLKKSTKKTTQTNK